MVRTGSDPKKILVNCKPCQKDKHDECTNPKSCRCADNKHGIKLKYNPNKPIEENNDPIDILNEDLVTLKENGDNQDPTLTSFLIAEHLVIKQNIIDKGTIYEYLDTWQKFRHHKLDSKTLKTSIESVWTNKKTFSKIKSIARNLGLEKKEIMLDKDQLIEVSEWIIGRYHIKRTELTGDLLFFNEYYKKDAEALIRRSARNCFSKSKNNDMNEVVRYIEDTCPIITNKDIERDVHLKCLLNGIYNIKTGKFSKEFNPDYIILNQIPHNYDNKSKFTQIKKRVSQIIVDKKNIQSYFDFASTCLHPYTGIDFQFGGVGIAGTGKSQLTDLLLITFGDDNVSNSPIHRIANDPTTQKDVAYSMLNIDEESKNSNIENIEVWKTWITQGRMTARSIYGHNTNFRPTARIMFATNTIYEIGNPDDALAIYERTHLIKLTQKFRHTKKEVKKVFEIIKEKEYDGFITFLLKNATKIYKNKGIKYPQSTFETESLWNEFGNEIRKFIDTWLEKGVGLTEQAAEIWNKFFTEQSSRGLNVKGKNQFYDKFNEIIGSTSTQIREGDERYWGYLGIKLRTIEEKDQQERIDQTPKGSVLKLIDKREESDPIFKELKRLLT